MARSLKTSENKNKKDQEEVKENTIGALSPKNMDLPEAKTVDDTVANKKSQQL